MVYGQTAEAYPMTAHRMCFDHARSIRVGSIVPVARCPLLVCMLATTGNVKSYSLKPEPALFFLLPQILTFSPNRTRGPNQSCCMASLPWSTKISWCPSTPLTRKAMVLPALTLTPTVTTAIPILMPSLTPHVRFHGYSGCGAQSGTFRQPAHWTTALSQSLLASIL